MQPAERSLAAISRIVLNTGIRPPKEVPCVKKAHVNLSGRARYCKVEGADALLPPGAVLVAKGMVAAVESGASVVAQIERVCG